MSLLRLAAVNDQHVLPAHLQAVQRDSSISYVGVSENGIHPKNSNLNKDILKLSSSSSFWASYVLTKPRWQWLTHPKVNNFINPILQTIFNNLQPPVPGPELRPSF